MTDVLVLGSIYENWGRLSYKTGSSGRSRMMTDVLVLGSIYENWGQLSYIKTGFPPEFILTKDMPCGT
jgi:hypothetical protein